MVFSNTGLIILTLIFFLDFISQVGEDVFGLIVKGPSPWTCIAVSVHIMIHF